MDSEENAQGAQDETPSTNWEGRKFKLEERRTLLEETRKRLGLDHQINHIEWDERKSHQEEYLRRTCWLEQKLH